jgi:hypothetical protein
VLAIGADGPLSFSGRAVEKDTGTPVAGVTIVVARTLAGARLPGWVGETTLRTDIDRGFPRPGK